MKAYIYKKTIIKTGKCYIGKHNGNNNNYKGGGVDYLNDYKKFITNRKLDLKEEILEYINDVSTLNEREKYWLDYYDAADNPLFYNKTNKSYGPSNHTNESKSKIGKSNSKPKPQIFKDKMKGKNKNTPRSKETKEKISKALLGRKTPWVIGKNIHQFSLKGEFIQTWENMKIAACELNISYETISCCISEKCKSAGGFLWVRDKNKINKVVENYNNKYNTLKTPIIQIDPKTNKIIDQFSSQAEAFRKTKIKGIQHSLSDKNLLVGGYVWKYRVE